MSNSRAGFTFFLSPVIHINASQSIRRFRRFPCLPVWCICWFASHFLPCLFCARRCPADRDAAGATDCSPAISPRTGRSFVTAVKYTIDPPGTAPNSHAAAAARSGAHAPPPRKSRPPARYNSASRLGFPCDIEDRRSGRQNRVDSRPGSSSRWRRSCAQKARPPPDGLCKWTSRDWRHARPSEFSCRCSERAGTVTKLRRSRAVGTVQTRHGRRDRTRHASRTLPLIPTPFWSPQSNIH